MSDRSFLSWPFFDDVHRALADKIEEWAAAKVPAITDGHGHSVEEVDAVCRELVAKMGEDGWCRYTVPADQGGISDKLDVRSLCIIRETLARYAGLADFSFVMQGLGSGPVSLFGTDGQKASVLPQVGRGEMIAAFALSEPEAGSDVAALTTTAVPDGNGYVLNGTKTWISNGGIADYYTVFARTGEAAGAKGLSCFLVSADTPGFEIAERIEVIAPHPLATLSFKDCHIPGDALIGEAGSGFKIAMSGLDIFRSTVGAAALGFARRALDETLERTTKRELFGAPLAELQMTQGALAEMATDVDASALLVYRSAWTKDCAKDRVTRESSMAKLFATEQAQLVIDKAVQLFGGHGVVSGNPVEQLYREIRALRIYEGASEVQKVVIARQTIAEYSAENRG